MNLFHLRYFETLARTEHYSKAAEILSITQPSLSYAISTLESELGIQLFEKRGRNIVPVSYTHLPYSAFANGVVPNTFLYLKMRYSVATP